MTIRLKSKKQKKKKAKKKKANTFVYISEELITEEMSLPDRLNIPVTPAFQTGSGTA